MQKKNPPEPEIVSRQLMGNGSVFFQKPEWKNVKLGENFRSDFSILGGHVIISRPSGNAVLPDVQKSLSLYQEVRKAGIPENAPYIHIIDDSGLKSASLSARRYFIDFISKQECLRALIFCNVSPIMRLSIGLGKRIYPLPFDVFISDTLSDAADLAFQILKQKGIIKDATARTFAEPIDRPEIATQDDWMLQTENFSLRFEIIDGDIFHPVPSGCPHKEDVDPIFELQQKVFIESGLKENAYCLVSDLASMKSADIETRHYFVKRLRQWHRRYPFNMLIFYNANWVMRAAINLSKTTAPYDVHVVDDLPAAIELIRRQRPIEDEPGQDGTKLRGAPEDPSRKYLTELLGILSGISWDAKSPESILQTADPDHPFRQIVEAVSLIKMDVDHVLAERDRSEKALLDTTERYKTILNNIEEGYYEVDLAGNVTFFNPSLCAILGYSEKELTGLNYREFSSGEDVDNIFGTFNQVYRSGTPAKALDWKLNRKDGARCYIEASVTLIKDNSGKPCGFRGICRDITQRVTAEQEKLNIMDRLRQAQKMEAIGLLAGGVAHDLNNILSGIVSYPDLLLMKLPPDSPMQKPLETIKKSGERAAAIVQDLLTLARQGMSKREILNLNTVIIDHLNSPEHQHQMALHPLVEIRTDLDSHLLNLSASPLHMIKILMNLISNAAEAMPDGGELHISTENFYLDTPEPDLPALIKGEYVLLKIKDHGVGILDADKGRIFEPFYTKKIMGRSGTGLGMALVWGAVRDHEGSIDLESAPGKGTTIRIFLPATRTAFEEKPAEINLDGFRGKGETVLVVDDLEDQRTLAAEILTQLGYSAHTAQSGEAAIEVLKMRPMDLVFLDMIMHPGMDGLDTYKEILKIRPGQKAIIATGFSTSGRIKAALALGAGKCLKKPYLLKDIAPAVREELDS